MNSASVSPENCRICNQKSHGKHFGVVSCRPCSAFFRRAVGQGKTREKCEKPICETTRNGKFLCKICRLNKCYDAGMTSEKFQYDRDPHFASKELAIVKKNATIPLSMTTFLGRPNMILCLEPDKAATVKVIIDLTSLLNKAEDLLKQRTCKPYSLTNSLEKMSLNSEEVRRRIHKVQFQKVGVFGKSECMDAWERDFLSVVEWFTNFDEFRELAVDVQMKTIQRVWVLWTRLDKLAKTAEFRRKLLLDENSFFVADDVCIDVTNYEIDVSWFTNYTKEQLECYYQTHNDKVMFGIMEWMFELNPSDTELNFMFCQLCLQYAATIFRGEIEQKLEDMIAQQSNHLHDYYVKTMKMPNYLARLAKMMKINNCIVQDMRERRVKNDVAKIFGIFSIDFSHPDIIDGW